MKKIHFGQSHGAALYALVLACTLLSGCSSFYVDNGLRGTDTEQVTKPEAPKSVQLFYDFQTKGSPNLQATEYTKARVTDLVKGSGLFSQIEEIAAPGTATLQITINNIVLTEDVVSNGVLTGLTLGLVGNTVGDGYVCELRYSPSDGGPQIEAQASHAIYTSLGASNGPSAPATKVENLDEAITTMIRQAVNKLLIQLSNNPQFQSAS